MKITVLGSGSAVLVPARHSSAYIIQSNDKTYLIDAGDGVTQQLIFYEFDLNSIDSVFISHTHADHAAGIIMLIQTMQQFKRTAPLEIYIPDTVLPGFESIFPYFQIYPKKLSFEYVLKGISNNTVYQHDNFLIRTIANNHLQGNKIYASQNGLEVSSFSFLIKERNIQILYTSDINNFEHLEEYAAHTDLLISECTHISLQDINKFARSNHINKVILSHIPPEINGLDEKSTPLSSDISTIIIAKDGQEFEV